MPQIRFNGVNDKGKPVSFEREEGCLCLLGKYQGHIDSNKAKMEARDWAKTTSLEYLNLCMCNYPDEALPTLEKYMSMFPFMRCVLTPAKDMLKANTPVMFDAENYTLNEVMHAMFHLRNVLRHTVCAKYIAGGTTGLHVMHTLNVEYKFPFWQAFLTAMSMIGSMTHISSGNSLTGCKRECYAHLHGGDESCYIFGHISKGGLDKLMSGEQPSRDYEGGTFDEHMEEDKAYVKNISSWLTDKRVRDDNDSIGGILGTVCHVTFKKAKAFAALRKASGSNNLFSSSSSGGEEIYDITQLPAVERVACLAEGWKAVSGEFNSEKFIC